MGWDTAVAKKPVEQFWRPTVTPMKIDWARVVTIDFETYWDTEYTLSKLSTSEYVRDPRFKAHMMAIKVGNKKTRVIPHHLIARELRKIDWAQYDLLCHNTAFDGFILSHHYGVVPRTYYDTLSMARGLYSNDIGAGLDEVSEYLGKGNKIKDVLEDSRGIRDLPKALYGRMAVYCAQDDDLTFEIFKEMVEITPVSEMLLMDLTVRMFCDPVLRVDLARVQIELARELKEREDLLLSIDVAIYDVPKEDGKHRFVQMTKAEKASFTDHEKRLFKAKKIVGSSEGFANLLRAEGIEPPVKISPAWIKKPREERRDEDKWAYAFAKDDADFIGLPERVILDPTFITSLNRNKKSDVAKLAALSERVKALVEVRLAVKSTTNITRAQRFLTAGANGMPLPVGYAYARAHTLRWGGNNKMNMQNLKRGGELRQSILAPKGHVMCVVDSGQIECRMNGWLWGQDDLMEDFRKSDAGIGRDAYCNFGDIIYGRTITKADKTERFVSKVGVLGLGFQMGAEKFQGTLAKGALGGPPVFFTLDQCKVIVNAYRRKNYKIVAGWAKCNQIIEDMAAGRSGSHKCITWEEGRIWGPDGTCLKYPNLKKSFNEDKGWDQWTYESKGVTKSIYGGLLCENIVQWLARMVVATQMLEISAKRRVVMMTHDEVVAIAQLRAAEKCFKEMMVAMRRPPSWCADIPLDCEGGYAENYSK